ncbi:PIN domain-containing protein [Mariniphaga sp.]|uniref:PIN domain-containing protein n=1 Tax=Mariniphaga sp. TaxID=1954475 RepID=UPI0035626952
MIPIFWFIPILSRNWKNKKFPGNLSKKQTHSISTQVLQELVNTLTKKFGKTWKEANEVVIESGKNNKVFSNESKTISDACLIAEKYQYSFYDSLIISSALSCNCKTLFSEDLQNGQVIEDNLKIVNPFL